MKEKILEILKSADGYISGEAISKKLDISRAAVWKHIKALRSKGYEIDSVTNRGYRLLVSPDKLTAEEIKSGLDTRFVGQNVYFKEETDSTNNDAKRNSGAPDGSVFTAEIQNGGKGRLGRGWSSLAGVGIWMSVLLKPEMKPYEVPRITQVAGLAVCRALKEYGAAIKWPNDIIIGTKKVCGILTEMSAETDMVNYIVCGIGINVNTPSFPDEIAERATSVYIETGVKHNRAEIARRVLRELEALYEDYKENGLGNMLDEYKSRCVNLGREVSVTYEKRAFTGTAVDINENGELVVETEKGTVNISSGEASVRGIYGYV